ncbi:MAG: hypothetical protein WCI74_02885 [Actinomycetes bacterium]
MTTTGTELPDGSVGPVGGGAREDPGSTDWKPSGSLPCKHVYSSARTHLPGEGK